MPKSKLKQRSYGPEKLEKKTVCRNKLHTLKRLSLSGTTISSFQNFVKPLSGTAAMALSPQAFRVCLCHDKVIVAVATKPLSLSRT